MLTAVVPDYILSSGVVAQRSRPQGGRGRLSVASVDSVASSQFDFRMADEDSSEIKTVLGYLAAPQRGWSQQSMDCDVPRLVHF
ncbi:hypothetical protein GGI25_000238 [Coemansia spiralis]|uniref:Uncharacterized protein n=2 Tax=Coemansia TaxID=4863 RepID=A0A9W8L1I6_9FUNG|nr:hypothetical protein EDC05_000548 [Coemansia umbellata]KAJ2625811.1 hypothetical protein GGI26_000272 [Coemansia sp. RSA 1358]KAJ2680934.1 hypothetical protein GGI25_000238 [Coemansia spiralis]